MTARRNPFVASFVLLLVAGCSSPPALEQEGDYVEILPLIYDYGLVFDCAAEAIAEEGLPVTDADRDKGTLETEPVPGRTDRLHGTQAGTRVKVLLLRRGDKNFAVRLLAAKLERDLGSDNIPGEWRYAGKDEILLERLKKRFEQQVNKRYKPAPDRGG